MIFASRCLPLSSLQDDEKDKVFAEGQYVNPLQISTKRKIFPVDTLKRLF
jgi:hypothetical protein